MIMIHNIKAVKVYWISTDNTQINKNNNKVFLIITTLINKRKLKLINKDQAPFTPTKAAKQCNEHLHTNNNHHSIAKYLFSWIPKTLIQEVTKTLLITFQIKLIKVNKRSKYLSKNKKILKVQDKETSNQYKF